MNELIDDCSVPPSFEQEVTEVMGQWIDRAVETRAAAIEARFLPQIVQLEHTLEEEASLEAFAIYQEIDMLVADEKRDLMRVCFLDGLAAGMAI